MRVIRTDHLLMFFGSLCLGLGAGAITLVATARQTDQSITSSQVAIVNSVEDGGARFLQFPALFGIHEPSPVAVAETQAIASTEYTLRGLVAAKRGGWAIVGGPEGEFLVQIGSVLPDGGEVVALTKDGVEIRRNSELLLIGFSEEDASVRTRVPATAGAPTRLSKATLSLKELREDGLQRTLGLAGGTQVVDLGNGKLAQEVVWIRKGRFFDQLGLQQSDVLVSINGTAAGDIEALTKAAPSLFRARSFEVEILRTGSPMILEVTIDEDDA